MTPPPLTAAQLAVGYRGRPPVVLLSGLNLHLVPGELVAVLGKNGAGKSTLLRTLAGLQPPLAGHLEILGQALAALTPRERARRIGVVLPQRLRPSLLTGRELVALGRHAFTGWSGRLSRDDHDRVERALQQVGGLHLAARQVVTLSDGELQKLQIARALAQEPTLLVLDEPTAFLDLPGRVEILALLRRLARQGEAHGQAVLLSTHDLELALRLADRLFLLTDDSVCIGAPEDLVLSGAFAQAFASTGLTFDLNTGAFRLREPAAPVQESIPDAGHGAERAEATPSEIWLEGSGAVSSWTQRALERAGYGVRRLSDKTAAGSDGIWVVAEGEPGSCRWHLSCGAKTSSHPTVHALLRELQHAP